MTIDDLSRAVSRLQIAAERLRRLHASMHVGKMKVRSMHVGKMKVRWSSVAAYLIIVGVLHIAARTFGLPVVAEIALLFVGCVAVQTLVGKEWPR